MKKAYFWMAISIAAWGLSTTFVDLGLRDYGPIPSLIYRFGLASILTILILAVTKNLKVLQLFKRKITWVVGILDSAGMIFAYYAQSFGIPPGLTSLLMILYVIWTPLFSRLILKKSLQTKHIIAVFFSILGLVLIITEGNFDNLITGNSNILGYILLILTSISWSLYFVFGEIQQKKGSSTTTDTYGNFSSVILINFFCSAFIGVITLDFAPPPPDAWIWILLLVIFSTIIAFFTYYEALKEIDANLVSLLLLTQIIIPYFIDIVFLNKDYTIWVIIGSIILLLSAVLAALPPFKKSRRDR
ncbi:MAG: DMT family transporter [Promethearchaeota archaeon]